MLMFSMPPATTTWASPNAMAWAPMAMAFIPLAQTLFTVVHGTSCPHLHPGSLPRRRLTCTGLEHLPHEHFLHRRGVDASVLQGAFDGDGTKSGGGHRGQFALKASHGCPDCGHDVHCV